MTCNRNIALLVVLVGTSFLGLAGCQSQPYKPWQPDDSWWAKTGQTRGDAEAAKSAEMTATAKEMQVSRPEPAETAPANRAPEPVHPVAPAEHVIPRHTDPQAPPAMVIRETEVPLASRANTSGRTSGDVLLIDSIQSAPVIETPHNGMRMVDVRQQYGDPIAEGIGIGDPPITRWEYEGFSVYFEYDLVLHSVIHRATRN